MSLVKFSLSGVITTQVEGRGILASWSGLSIIDPRTKQVLHSSVSTSGKHPFLIDDVKDISRDSYIIAPYMFGYNGVVEERTGLSPTEEVINMDFQPVPLVSGEVLYYNNFEDISVSGLTITYTGTAPTQSGIIASTEMVGDYYFTYKTTSLSTMMLDPSPAIPSGIPIGRVTLLARNVLNSSSTNSYHVGVAFARQGPSITASGIKCLFNTTTAASFDIPTYVGNIATAGGSLTSAGAVLNNSPDIDFSSGNTRNALRRQWLIVEWEMQPDNTIINLFYKSYVAGDTVENIKDKVSLISQVIYRGLHGGTELYTSTSLPPAILLTSKGSIDVGVDEIQVESMQQVSKTDICNFTTLASTSGAGAMPYMVNRQTDSSQAPIPFYGLTGIGVNANPNLTKELSKTGIPGFGGSAGMLVSRNGGSLNQIVSSLLCPTMPSASGVLQGSVRALLSFANTGFSNFGVTVMRQGVSHDSSGYTFEVFDNSSNDFRVRIRKGQAYSTNVDPSAAFVGSIVATSATLNWASFVSGWVDFRWQVTGISTLLEVYFCPYSGGYGSFNKQGDVDHKLISVLAYTDNSSPYLSTSEPPMFIMRSKLSTNYFTVNKLEFRKAI